MTVSHRPRDSIIIQSSIRELRLSLGISQQELAIQAGVSRHSVIRTEQLCYPSPLPSLVSTLSDIVGTSESVITSNYLSDVHANRLYTADNYLSNHTRLIYLANTMPLSTMHPFQLWRETVCEELSLPESRIHFSQLCSIHPATLYKYETFKTGFPTPISVAFKEMGLPSELLKIFEEAMFNYIK